MTTDGVKDRAKSMNPYLEAHRKFRGLEEDLDLFEQQINGFYFWEYIRFGIWNKILVGAGITEQAQRPRIPRGRYVAITRRVHKLKRMIQSRRELSASCDYLFLGPGSDRRKSGPDGKQWDLYCDPIIDYLGPERCRLIELPPGGGYIPVDEEPHTKNIAFLESFSTLHKYKATRQRSRIAESEAARYAGQRLNQTFRIKVDLVNEIQKAWLSREIELDQWERVLKRQRPQVVFLICSYTRRAVIEASRALSIPCVEIQHGTISPYHMGYSYPEGARRVTFPDYFFSFGSFWQEQTCLPIAPERIKIVGYPYLLDQVSSYGSLSKRKKILFISQGTIGKQLQRFACDLRRILPDDWQIAFKLHPGEAAGWRERYPDLNGSGINVLETEPPTLYELLAEAIIQVGVYSTAIFEGLAFGCKTYLVNLPGIEYMTRLIDEGAAIRVDSADEIDLNVREEGMNDVCRYFGHDWELSFEQALQFVLSSTS